MPRLHKWSNSKNYFFLLPDERKRLKQFCKYGLLTEKELASGLGLTRSSFHCKLYAGIAFSMSEFGKLCHLVNCTPRDVLCNPDGKIELEAA